MSEAELRLLLDRTRVIDTVVAAANALDAQDWAALRACLADQVETDYRDFRGEPPARVRADDYVDARRRGLAGLRTVHLSTNHAVEIRGDRARCVSAYRIYRVDPSAPEGEDRLDTAGHYEHGLVRTPAGWRIDRIVQTVAVRSGRAAVHGAFRGTDAAAGRPGPAAGTHEAP